MTGSGRIRRIDSRVGIEPLFDVAATRRIEAAALAAAAPFALMARAGDAVARLALALTPHAGRVLVLAGPGHNGGDGLVAATRLRVFGKRVEVRLVAHPANRTTDAARALAEAQRAGIDVAPFDPGQPLDADLLVDAVLGIGASRAPEGIVSAAIAATAAATRRGARVFAVDVPSGLDADRGRLFGTHAIVANDTLTMLTLKPGLFTGVGRDHAGRVWLADLDADTKGSEGTASLAGARAFDGRIAPRLHASHKGSFGDVAVVGGAPGMLGAAVLAARAAHAAGAGRIFVDALDDADAATISWDPARPELMWRRGGVPDDRDALARTTVVAGCGGGIPIRDALPRLLSLAPRIVLDADALNAVAGDAALARQLASRASRLLATVLTPHPLEAARLLDSTVADVQGDRLAAAHALAERYGSVIVLKGSGTVVAAPGCTCHVAASGNASLATGGTGDVLAGWLGGRWASATVVTDDRPAASDPFSRAFAMATLAVVEHGLAVEPDAGHAVRAADLVDLLRLRARR